MGGGGRGGRWDMLSSEYSGGSHDADHVTHLMVKGAMMRIM